MLSEKVQANERIRAVQIDLGLAGAGALPFICECDDVSCRVLVRLTSAAYADVRAHAGRCIVAAGHPCRGTVLGGGDGYSVVEDVRDVEEEA